MKNNGYTWSSESVVEPVGIVHVEFNLLLDLSETLEGAHVTVPVSHPLASAVGELYLDSEAGLEVLVGTVRVVEREESLVYNEEAHCGEHSLRDVRPPLSHLENLLLPFPMSCTVREEVSFILRTVLAVWLATLYHHANSIHLL